LDVGCGANLIYPLLGAAQHGWRFVAADVTDAAISGATANLAANPHLAHLIQVLRWLWTSGSSSGGLAKSSRFAGAHCSCPSSAD
jgi:23S rRNA (adenine1618-N6)-methyltransferase